MNKRLAINLAANVISYSTTVIVALVLTPFLVKNIGIDAYSFYPLAQNIVNYIGFLTVALNSMASRFITIEYVRGNIEGVNKYFSSIFISNLILSALLFPFMLLMVIYINRVFNVPIDLIPTVRATFALIFISFAIQTISSVFAVATFAKNRMDYRSLIEITQGIARVVLFYVLYSFFKAELYYVGVVAVVISIIFASTHFYFTKKLLPEVHISLKNFEVSYIKEIVSSGIWNSVNQLGTMLVLSVSIILANLLISPKAAGEFSIVQTIPGFVSGIISMVAGVLLPEVTRHYAKNDKEMVIKSVIDSQKILGVVTNIPIAIFIAVGQYFFMLWVPNEDSYRLQILFIMTISYLLAGGVVWPIANLNTIMNRVKVPALLMLGGGVVNVILAIVLCLFTPLEIYAIPLATMIVLTLYFVVFIPVYPCEELGISKFTFYPALMKTTVGAILIFFSTKVVMQFITIDSWMSLLLVCVVSGFIGLIINGLIIFGRKQLFVMLGRVVAYAKSR